MSIGGQWAATAGLIVYCLASVTACEEGAPPQDKIRFDLATLDDRGLYGPPDGLRSLDYEFCIPADAAAVSEVLGIDPTLRIHRDSPGRIGCSSVEFLCIGNTDQGDFRAVLIRLAELPYVERIEQAYFE